jgi:hypothetical protein
LKASGNSKMVRELEICSAAPRAMLSMPRVTMKEWIFQRSQTTPLKKPHRPPTSVLPSTESRMARPGERSSRVMSRPPTMEASASTEPTERSMPPSRITKVIPTEITVLMLIWLRMLLRLAIDAKRGAKAEKTRTMMTSASPMPTSRSRR